MEQVSHKVAQVVLVEPAQGREAQLLYWFRVCVAEWHNEVSPRCGTAHEEILVWDKGRGSYVLEAHWYGKDVRHRCERAALDEQRIRDWIRERAGGIVWRGDAIEFYPWFILPAPAVASNDPLLERAV